MGGRREVSIISHTPVNRSDLQQERSFFHGSVSTFLQLVVAPARIQNFIHPCLRYPFLQHQISNYQQILCHVFQSRTTEEFIFPAICIGVRLSNALPQNIEKSASGNLSKKQMHETLSCINIFKQENLYLTPSSILEILKLKTCKTVAILQIRPVLIVPDPFLSLFSLCSNFVVLFLFAIFHSLSLF